jgi:hypothetical protein
LASRGLTDEEPVVARFRLGVVDDPLPGHEMYRGMLAIPYMRRAADGSWTVVSMRFRCIEPDCEHRGHGKYNTVPGDRPRLYNTVALVEQDDEIAITEGELDAVTATACGVPAVAVPGVEAWRDYFRPAFEGYETVYVLADNDIPKVYDGCPRCKGECRGHNPGMEFARRMAKELPNAKVIPMPSGEDVNSTVLLHGKTAFLERLGK